MPQGQWVAFDASTEESHICGIKNEPDVSVKLKNKKRKKSKDNKSIDLGYEDNVLETKKDSVVSKTYSNSSGVNYCIDKAIIGKKRILIPLPLPLALLSAKIFQLLPNPLLTEDQVRLLKYNNILSGKYKSNFDIGVPSKRYFDEEVKKYSYMWREGGQFSTEKYLSKEDM